MPGCVPSMAQNGDMASDRSDMRQLRLFPGDDRLTVAVLDRGRGDGALLLRRLRRSRRFETLPMAPSELRANGLPRRVVAVLEMVEEHPSAVVGVRHLVERLGEVPLVAVVEGHHELALAVLEAGAAEALELEQLSGPRLERVLLSAVSRRVAERRDPVRSAPDPLTGLMTRAGLGAELPQRLAEAEDEGRSVAVLYADLDRFKAVNDSRGHAAGDQVLVEAAARLRRAVRSSDLVVRLGGDEFVVVLDGPEVQRVADEVARRIVEGFSAPFRVDGHDASVGISVGLALAHEGESAADVLARADRALYLAKSRGRGRVARYDESVHEVVARQATATGVLRDALDRDLLELCTTPVVERSSGALVGHMSVPAWGAAGAPGVILHDGPADVAADAGLCRQLVTWTVGHVLADVHRPRPVGADVRRYVHLPRPLLHASPAKAVEAASGPGADLTSLVAVVDEAAVLDPSDDGGLRELLRAGIRLAVGGFGEAVGSLRVLERYPFDSVWVAPSVVDGLADDPVRRAQLRATLEVAASLGQRVVVEEPGRRADDLALGAFEGVAVAQRSVDLGLLEGHVVVRPEPADGSPRAVRQ